MDDPAVFTSFVRNTLMFITQKMIDAITNFVESFGDFLAVNYGDVDTFVKDNHSANNAIATAQRILISNNVT